MTEQKSKTSTERQRELKARRVADGYKHTTVWIHAATVEEGKQAAREGKPLEPLESKDPLSWAAGWISEKIKR
ncbi:hypothetical protein IBA8401_22640 [Pseudomonas syringae]|uniref:hypothetical protein n=1 Tax=Pseudomonas syringae group TaxID=136849 RepID=UPI00030B742F|nr:MULTISPECIES: hypothetical protein [Pseudomonas syringae group]MCZ0949917.1 hypothetical protein [Pseudomonas syringae pv. tomato]